MSKSRRSPKSSIDRIADALEQSVPSFSLIAKTQLELRNEIRGLQDENYELTHRLAGSTEKINQMKGLVFRMKKQQENLLLMKAFSHDSKWIDEKTAKPMDSDELVLVVTPTQYHPHSVDVGFFDDESKEWLTQDGRTITVNYWQPLPVAPE